MNVMRINKYINQRYFIILIIFLFIKVIFINGIYIINNIDFFGVGNYFD